MFPQIIKQTCSLTSITATFTHFTFKFIKFF